MNPISSWTHTGYAQQILFGAGSLAKLSDLLRSIGARRVMLVTTAGRASSSDGRRVADAVRGSLVSTFAGVESHVPAPTVQAALLQARRDGIDGLVSFGGGSCADTAKAVAFFTEQEGGTPATSFADRPVLPHVSIPTTYSGAELTPFFGMTDPRSRTKSGAGGPTSAPLAAIHDPELTLSTPARVSAETGMNALAHCVEAVWAPRRTPEAEAVALGGFRRIMHALPMVVDAPGDIEARTAMLEGAVLAGRCLQNAPMGIHHGLSQLVGGRTGIPHGLANAVILPHAIRYNAPAVPDAVAALAGAVDVEPARLADVVAAMASFVGLPDTLSACGVSDEDVDAVVRLSQSSPAVRANPRPAGEDDVRVLLHAAF